MTLQGFAGTDLPIVQAPMAGAQGSALAIAVSNAGGLGSLPCAMLTPEAMHGELSAIAAATSRPFNVNFFCHTPPRPDAGRDARWQSALARYYDELGVDPAEIPPAQSRMPFSAEHADALEPFRPPIVSFHFGLPAPALVARVKTWGTKILSTATTVDEALWLEAHGVDAIVAQGVEAGGHRGMFLSDDVTTQVGTFALVPQIVRAVAVPVLAAGGIASAAGVAAAMRLGAMGVQVGTAYLLCPESTINALHRAALKSDAARHTALTNVFTGRPARAIVNRFIREVGPVSALAPSFPLATRYLLPLAAKAAEKGSADFLPMWAGQNTTGCKELSAAHLTRELAGA